MITWILGPIIIIWCIIKRFSTDGKVEDYPFGFPRGTIRAIITLMVVAFPFNYLLANQEIPSMITNSIFFLVAFYFEARKTGEEKLKLVKEIRNPEKYTEEAKKEKKPLYLPKFSVRIILVILLVFIVIINFYGPNVPFEATNTILDILVLISFFFIGMIFRSFGLSRQKKKLKKQIEIIPDYKNLSKYEILEKLEAKKPSAWKKSWKNLISLLTFVTVTTGLIFFTLNLDYTIPLFGLFNLSIREGLLLLINAYYGFRD
ncbi:MAG: hypothetical protein ACFE85_10850 [Candidatus Hodarchaeota archaeon]